MSDTETVPEKKPQQVIIKIDEAPEVPGRRDFFTYRDLGIKEFSNGKMSARTMKCRKAMTQSTGWHVHDCEVQINYVLKGWAELVFEDGTEIRVEAGHFQYVPGGIAHNEIRTSDDVESLELCIPADMGTRPVDPPEWWVKREAERARVEETA
jgi:quercetin dioxygenase-like cupin family protein